MAELTLDRGIDSLTRRALPARIAIYLFIVCAAVASLTHVATVGAMFTPPAWLAALAQYSVSILYIVASVPISMWIYRAHANLRAAGVEGLSFSPAWSVGWFFIPFASLFKPLQAMRELWNVSALSHDNYNKETPIELKHWWAGFIIGNAIANIDSRVTDYRVSLILSTIGAVALIYSAVWLLKIMHRITEDQRNHFRIAGVFA